MSVVTLPGEHLPQAMGQLRLPFPVDKAACAEFLTRVLTIEEEMDRLRESLQGLVALYTEQLPIRAVRTAIKVVRARQKLAEHHRDPMSYADQLKIEGFVQAYIAALDATKKQAAHEAEISTRLHAGERVAVDMTTGEIVP